MAKENEKESNQSGLINISECSWLEEAKEISKYGEMAIINGEISAKWQHRNHVK
jgi:hypothetical protein